MKILIAIIVLLNGKPIEFKQAKPFMQEGRVMVPLREVFEMMGATVKYPAANDTISVKRGDASIHFDMSGGVSSHFLSAQDSDLAQEVKKQSDAYVTPVKKNNRFFVPLRLVSETIGAKVQWQSDTHTVVITDVK